MMEEQDQDLEFEYDVFYRGTKQQLYAFLYPLTGPENSLFEHLSLAHLYHNAKSKSFEAAYETKDFENIDRQKEQIIYKSTPINTQSNYFYSLYQPDYKCFLWQNVRQFVEMRPKNTDTALQKDKAQEDVRIQLETVKYQQSGNKASDIIQSSMGMSAKDNWEVSKQEYLQFLAK